MVDNLRCLHVINDKVLDGPTDRQTLLYRCDDASKNEGGGWLVGDLKCIHVIHDQV